MDQDQPMPDRSLDTSGMTCPIPILKAKKALSDMAPGDVLAVVATDPAAPNDFLAFCKATGHSLLVSSNDERQFRFLIRRA